ncbi:hypothetical protein PY365_19845 [Roseiarcaceae bacterium H3SJ34-1]|uniref:hypothetical protein n=1 Tax=Terripilifer ovatus TaxID=3032367 RepID=UPI003AB9839F|nr:hypothetical protein [Roseiarcaceae bacterium H3SJ34-1]
MITKMAFRIATLIVCLGPLAPANAQSSIGPTWNDTVSLHHQLQYRMMSEMTREMSQMTEQMVPGALTFEESTKMAKRMAFMSTMMRRMSGLEARPAHTHAQLQNQMDQMRRLMDEMTNNPRMAPGAK